MAAKIIRILVKVNTREEGNVLGGLEGENGAVRADCGARCSEIPGAVL